MAKLCLCVLPASSGREGWPENERRHGGEITIGRELRCRLVWRREMGSVGEAE